MVVNKRCVLVIVLACHMLVSAYLLGCNLLSTLLTYLLTSWSVVLFEKQTSSQLVKNSPHFMELEGSLPPSLVSSTCPYPEPDRSSPCPTSHFLKIRINIVLTSMPGSSKWSLSLRSPHQNPVYTSPLPHTCYIPQPFHSSRFYHPNNIGWVVQIIKLLIF